MAANGRFVGRVEELALADRALGDADLHGLVLAGAAGVGKTRLAREVVLSAERKGRAAFWVSASAAVASIPFGAVAHLLADELGTDRLRVLQRSNMLLAEAAGGRDVVLGVDDAHLLDEASAALIYKLSSSGGAFVVATVRSGELASGPVAALWRDGLAERVEVQPLSRAETGALVEALLGSHIAGIAQERLWRLSGGNALYLSELVRGGIATGGLTRRGGVWDLVGRVAAAPRLVELIAARVGDQSVEVRALLDLLAFGEPLEVDMLLRTGVAAAAIEAAELDGLVRTEPGTVDIDVRLAHPLFGEVAREEASPLHRREVCRRLAEASGADADPVRTAVWHLDGEVPVDPALLLVGASRSAAALDLMLSRRLAHAAVEAGGGVDAERLLTTIHMLCGDSVAAESLLAALDARELPDIVRAELAAARAWNLTFALGRPNDAERVLAAAEGILAKGWERLACQRAVLLMYAGRPTESVEMAAPVLDRSQMGESVGDEATVRALAVTCQSLAVLGRLEDGVRAGERAIDLYRDLHGRDWSMTTDEVLGGLAGVLMYAGRLDKAQRLITEGCERTAAAGWAAGSAFWLGWQADVALARGMPATAARYLREAAAVIATSAHPYNGFVGRLVALLHVKVAAQVGAADDAAAALQMADRLARPWIGVLDGWGGSSPAWVAAARGETSAAVELALTGAKHARDAEQFYWEVLACHQVVRFGAPERVIGRMTELDTLVDGAVAPLYVRHCTALTARDGPRLDEVAAGFEVLGYRLLAAEAAAHAARAHHDAGSRGLALGSRTHGRDLAARCEGARTPALASLSDPSGLTRRETEIARLAAGGLTNRDIADTLVISVRTVDNTLHQVYTKLAINGRTELTSLFETEG